jgi:hypothetical protein
MPPLPPRVRTGPLRFAGTQIKPIRRKLGGTAAGINALGSEAAAKRASRWVFER